MSKYMVCIARNETTVYTMIVNARSEKEAEKKAVKRYENGDYDDEDVVYGEEEVHCVEEVEDIEK